MNEPIRVCYRKRNQTLGDDDYWYLESVYVSAWYDMAADLFPGMLKELLKTRNWGTAIDIVVVENEHVRLYMMNSKWKFDKYELDTEPSWCPEW